MDNKDSDMNDIIKYAALFAGGLLAAYLVYKK